MTNGISNANNHLTPVIAFTEAQSSQGAEEAGSCSSTTQALPELPLYVVEHILGFSSLQTLGRSARVCKLWKEAVSNPCLWTTFDLKREFRLLNIIDETTWQTHVDLQQHQLNVKGAAPLGMRTTIRTIKEMLALPIEKINGVNPGVTILTIPAGLTINKLGLIAQNPKLGNPTGFNYIWDRITAKYGDESVDKTYQVVIANNILQGTKNGVPNDQKVFMDRLKCQMPTLVEAITLAFLTYISSGASQTRLFVENPRTFIRVIERVSGFSLVVGGFAPDGLRVRVYYGYDNSGVLGLRKFCPLELGSDHS